MLAALQRALDNRTTVDTGGINLPISRAALLAFAAFTGAAIARLVLALWTISRGYVEYNADGFSRVIRGYEWLQAPRWEIELWLPLHFWLYGAVFWVWNDLFTASRVLNFALGLAVIAGVYLIGSTLSDRRVGAIAAMLVAIFPYEVWLSLSGMSEPLFHALIVSAVAGFVWWWRNESRTALLVSAGLFAAATAVRYEAWFFVAVFGIVILLITFVRRRASLPYVVLSLVIASSFMALWAQQNWQVHGDPLAFVHGTEEAKLAEDPSNVQAGVGERIMYFPDIALDTAPGIVVIGLFATAFLLYTRRDRWWPLLALIWGQAIVLITVTSIFASQGPGAERYLLANTILLCVPIAGMVSLLIDRYGSRGLLAGGLAIALLIVSFVPEWISPPTFYPAGDTQTLANELDDALSEQEDGIAVVLLPGIPDERFNEGYALRVLSGHPGRVEITDTPSRLYEAVQQGEAAIWVMDDGVDASAPPAEEKWETGGYIAGEPPPPAHASTDQTSIVMNDELTVDGSGFLPNERISTWWTAPDQEVLVGPELRADDEGEISGATVPMPDKAYAGTWALTIAGQESQRQAILQIEVRE